MFIRTIATPTECPFSDFIQTNPTIGFYRTRPEGKILAATNTFAKILGYESVAELSTKKTSELYVCRDEQIKIFEHLQNNPGSVFRKIYQCYRKDGSIIWLEDSGRLVLDSQGNIAYLEGCIQDVTEQKQQEVELSVINNLLQAAEQLSDPELFFEKCHEQVKRLLPADNFMIAFYNKKTNQVEYIYYTDDRDITCPPKHRLGSKGLTDHVIHTKQPYIYAYAEEQQKPRRLRLRTTKENASARLGVPLFIDNEVIGALIVQSYTPGFKYTAKDAYYLGSISRNLSCQLDSQNTKKSLLEKHQELSHVRTHDGLTGMLNQIAFISEIRSFIATSPAEKPSAIIIFDIAQFRKINLSPQYGRKIGDQLLKCVATRIQHMVRPNDSVCHLAADKFGLLLKNVRDIESIAAVTQKIQHELHKPFFLLDKSKSKEIQVRVYAGISIFPLNGSSAEQLLKSAEAALIAAKQDHTELLFFDSTTQRQVLERISYEQELYQALKQKEFVVYYQPKYDRNKRISGMEALVRWNSPQKGLILPGHFISVLEDIGLIGHLGYFVLQEACTYAQSLIATNSELCVAVNLSTLQLNDPDLVQNISHILLKTGLPAKNLELEITESAIMANRTVAKEVLEQLRNLGICISIDDFGTGHSSLEILSSLTFDKIKLDQSFVKQLDEGKINFVKAIVNLAGILEKKIVIEGIEKKTQADFFLRSGFKKIEIELQGFYFNKALSAADFSQELQRQRR